MNDSFVPIYKQLTDFYRRKIVTQECPPGSRIDSITRIMNRHGVARETAKLILKKLASEGLIISIVGKGTFVAPAKKVNKCWGMIIPFYSSNIEQLIGYLSREAEVRGRQLLHFLAYNNPEEEKKLVGTMIGEGYEAIIVIPNYDETETSGFYRKLIPGNSSIVLIDNTMAGSYFNYVIQSYDLGMKRALEFLTLKTGKNLLLIKNNAWKGRNLLHELMERTFTGWIHSGNHGRVPFVISSMDEFTPALIREGSIGGILSCTDTDSVKAIARLKKWGFRVPEEVTLISYGNTELTECFDPPITVLDCQYREMAQKTAQIIEKGKSAGSMEQHIIYPGIIVRKT